MAKKESRIGEVHPVGAQNKTLTSDTAQSCYLCIHYIAIQRKMLQDIEQYIMKRIANLFIC